LKNIVFLGVLKTGITSKAQSRKLRNLSLMTKLKKLLIKSAAHEIS